MANDSFFLEMFLENVMRLLGVKEGAYYYGQEDNVLENL